MAGEEMEGRGIRLLKKGQKGLIHALFSRFGVILLLFLLQVWFLFSILVWFEDLQPYISGVTVLFTVVMVLYLLNSRLDPTAKITWLVIIMLMPVFGAFLLWFTKSEVGHRLIKGRVNQIAAQARGCIARSRRPCAGWNRKMPVRRRWCAMWREAAATRCLRTLQ